MRIGILTHHYVKNYGAFLQMKAMYETLRRLYPKAEIVVVNYVNPRHWRKNIIHILHFRFGIDTPATYIKKIQQLQTFTKYEHTIPRTHSVKSAEEIATLKLDLIVLGSDEIWNLCGSGYHPLKFGTGLEEQQTIAYAPSVGAVTEDTEVPAEVASGLKNIDRISGRDTETVKFIERVSGRNAEKMLDPTFLYNFDANIKKDKPALYSSAVEVVDKDLTFIRKSFTDNTFKNPLYDILTYGTPGCTFVFNKALMEKLKQYKPSVISMHDSWISFVCLAVNGFFYSDQNAYIMYRQHDANVLGAQRHSLKDTLRGIIKNKNVLRSDMAKEILKGYSEMMPEKTKEDFIFFAEYKDNLKYKLKILMLPYNKKKTTKRTFEKVKLRIVFNTI